MLLLRLALIEFDEPSSTLTFSASITRLISPPEAISSSGFSGSPGVRRNAALHRGPTRCRPARSLSRLHSTANCTFIASALICPSASFASFAAAAVRCSHQPFAASRYTAAFANSAPNSFSSASRFSQPQPASAPHLRQTQSPRSHPSAPYFRFSRSSAASRSSISPSLSGEAVTFLRKIPQRRAHIVHRRLRRLQLLRRLRKPPIEARQILHMLQRRAQQRLRRASAS